MTEVTEVETAPVTQTGVDVTDRRRPGRIKNVNPALLPILRSAEPQIDPEDSDQSSAIRGLAFGLLLSAPIWAAIAYLGTWFLS